MLPPGYPDIPGIVPLPAAKPTYDPVLGSAGMLSSGSSALAAVAAGISSPPPCPKVARYLEKLLLLSARLVGGGETPPKEIAEDEVIRLVFGTSSNSYLAC